LHASKLSSSLSVIL